MYSDNDTPKGWVAPFGYPRIKACSRLPVAFRSVPRPSSPPGAKASTECPSHAPTPCTGVIRTLRRKPCSRRSSTHSAYTHIPEHCPPATLAAGISAGARVRQTTRLLDGRISGIRSAAAQRATPDPPESSCASRDAPEPDSLEQRPTAMRTNKHEPPDHRPARPYPDTHRAHPLHPT